MSESPHGEGVQLATMAAQVSQVLVKQGEMGATLARIDERMKAVPDHELRIRELRAEVPPKLNDRLTVLETSKARSAGAAAALGALSGGGVATLIVWALSHH